MKENPYVGPRPYERRDRLNFYGRNRESRELHSLILAERVVLFYAQSGAGKTSLLNAQVIPALEQEGFNVLPVARVGIDLPPGSDTRQVDNVFVSSVLMALAGQERLAETLLHHTLRSFLEAFCPQQEDDFEYRPPLLILDQFEELFTTHRDRWQEAKGFFLQLREALDALPNLGVVFTMREDHVAKLDPYAPLLPHRLRARFRMERLSKGAALAAVKGPLKDTSRSFAQGVAEQLVEELLKERVATAPGETTEIGGEFVEPVQLQVVCQSLWRDLPPDVTVITLDHLQTFGDVNQALLEFYERSIKRAIRETGVREANLRSCFEDRLITPAGTRGTVYRGREKSGEIPNEAVDVLENLHLIRGEWRAGARWYELTHDRFIEPIQGSNKTWQEKRRRTLLTALGAAAAALVLILGLVFAISWTTQQRAVEQARTTATAAATKAEATTTAAAAQLSEAEATATVASAVVERQSRVRPLKPGFSVSGEKETASTIGTIGAFVRDARGGVYLLTAALALGCPDSDPNSPVVQPGQIDGGQTPNDLVGYVARCLPWADGVSVANLVGLARLEKGIAFEMTIPDPDVGPIRVRGVRQPALGMSVRKLGRTTGVTTGEITAVDVTFKLELPQGTLYFVNGILTSDMSGGGDDGALVVDEEGYAIGLIVAGSQTTTILAPIQDVLDSFGVQLVIPGQEPTPTPRPPSVELLVDELTVRWGPGQIFPALYVVYKGGSLIVQSKNLDFDQDPWFLIKVQQDGTEEWITGDRKYVKWYNVDNLSSQRGPAPPVDPHFQADRTSLTAGECTYLRWDVEGVYGVYLDGVGKVGQYAGLVCPKETRTYVLTIHQRDEQRVDHELTIYVSGQVTARIFVIEYHGCVDHYSQLGSVKGQVFDKYGRIIQGAAVTIGIGGGAWDDPANPAVTNEDGWYEWWLGVDQRISFLQLDIKGVRALFAPEPFEVTTHSACFQRIDFREQ